MARALNGRRVLAGALAILITAVALIAIPALTHDRYEPVLDDFGVVPGFRFTDEANRPFASESMLGRTTIVDFIFTRCDAICPDSTRAMLDLQERTADLDDRVGLVSFTVDPEYDTPAVLAAYARDFHADPRRWRFVTGKLAAMRQVIEGAFMTGFDRRGVTASGAPDIWHGQKFLLVDRDLHIRGLYDTDPPGLDRLARDARYLARHDIKTARASR
jgi:protein SCO1/2